ncbi:hypothetical protein SAMN06265365_11192 [Tistlia consotensis]|uniref:Uncharacterized protein n=1 Tax=Tistlia consotensis USBA 355 TaxID=560819 RepID=A0A1Y6C2E2_9PROT|nr:hypothetical protein [Tistlia consotensis]SMF33073.1 hypothetical protein SAMN05428998_11193 [Tistlia consotensis USBA 355]SNR69277.1 hypothetical protein SAMN06265365_11192 [Tistlia consotensis]
MPAIVALVRRRRAGRSGRLGLGPLIAVLATFLLVALVVGSLAAGVVWGIAGLLHLPRAAIYAALGASGTIAVHLAARTAQRSRPTGGPLDGAPADPEPERPRLVA